MCVLRSIFAPIFATHHKTLFETISGEIFTRLQCAFKNAQNTVIHSIGIWVKKKYILLTLYLS